MKSFVAYATSRGISAVTASQLSSATLVAGVVTFRMSVLRGEVFNEAFAGIDYGRPASSCGDSGILTLGSAEHIGLYSLGKYLLWDSNFGWRVR